MHLPPTLLPLLLALPTSLASTLHIHLPSTLPSLPPSTHATLTTHNLTLSAPLRRTNTLVFANIPPGSYLGEVYCRDWAFWPLRVDVDDGSEEEGGKMEVWQTFRGNEWENKGERLGGGVGDVRVEARVGAEKGFYEGRGGCELPFYFTMLRS